MKGYLSDYGALNAGGECATCGKRNFATKWDAKTAIRRMKGRDGALRAYRCGDTWHIGHPPGALLRGDISRDEIRPRGSR